jgi:hypothetical protein
MNMSFYDWFEALKDIEAIIALKKNPHVAPSSDTKQSSCSIQLR